MSYESVENDTTEALDCGVPADVEDYRFWCDGVLVSVIGMIGFVGNTLALIVLSRPSLRDVFHQLLFALACFDILYIVCGGINYTFRGFNAQSDVFTYMFPYFLHPVSHIAMAGTIFMTLAISIERYLGLCHPLLSPHSRKSWFYILPVVLVSVALNVPKFMEITFRYREVYNNATMANESYPALAVTELRVSDSYIRGYIMWTRLFSTAIIPVIMLLFLNTRIIIDIFSSSQRTQRFGSARRQRKEINLSVILLCIVVVFFCCHAARIFLDVLEFSNMEKVITCRPWHPGHLIHVLMYVSHFAMILNSSLNFFVYCMVGHTFRRELCRTLGISTSSTRWSGFGNGNGASRRSSRMNMNEYTLTAVTTMPTSLTSTAKPASNGMQPVGGGGENIKNRNGNNGTAVNNSNSNATVDETTKLIKEDKHGIGIIT